jgi:hypothetical protein
VCRERERSFIGEMRNTLNTSILLENMTGRDYLEDIGVDGRIILE